MPWSSTQVTKKSLDDLHSTCLTEAESLQGYLSVCIGGKRDKKNVSWLLVEVDCNTNFLLRMEMINGNKYGEYHFDIAREGERKSKLTYEWSVGTDDEMQTLLV